MKWTPKTERYISILTRQTMLKCRPYARQWSETVDLPLLLSQTKLHWSLAAVEADNDSHSATYDMEVQGGAGGQPKGPPQYTYEVVAMALRETMV
jgi:hypothetical protein